MAENSTNVFLDILQSFDAVPLIIAFCVSIAVGLLLGAMVYVILTWMSRRRAGSASITRRPPRTSHSSPRSRPAFCRSSSGYDRRSNNSLLNAAAFSFHRQTSSPDHLDAVGHKSSFRASTFHPLIQCSQIAREAEEGSQTTLPRMLTLTTSAGSAQTADRSPATPPRRESFWGNNNLRGFSMTQTPPPAYESIIRAYQETAT
ncbi:myc target protein 1 homolog [Austrofundulus limnaeus]|uniref:Myc target protein 1 homolog n=1 Tax=Austrofundulus limnaeus TaxID=52670 RepID=A0A2I4BCF8_AUSLI|nr:PREDICTED: myc target protein 1 homolog [Austrofundulus limnaeus]